MNIQFIIIHSTQEHSEAILKGKYDVLIERDGQVVSFHKFRKGLLIPMQMHIAYVGGKDYHGNVADNRTRKQRDALFDSIMDVLESHAKATTIADENEPPGFDVDEWLRSHEPELKDAA